MDETCKTGTSVSSPAMLKEIKEERKKLIIKIKE
jgi:hypothetical protein